MAMNRTCFVIMAIGDQSHNGVSVTAAELKAKYDDLIKESIVRADPTLNVVRADEISLPGSISSDILTHIMHADFVVADVTYPNPNVYYELGLRHACKPGTVIIRDQAGPRVPFDISHLRHFEYDNTPTGLKSLSAQLKNYFGAVVLSGSRPDSQFLELAKLTKYAYPDYTEKSTEDQALDAMLGLIANEDILNLLVRGAQGEKIDQKELLLALAKNPEATRGLLRTMFATGDLNVGTLFGTASKPAAQLTKK
jgi:hypothetical protein